MRINELSTLVCFAVLGKPFLGQEPAHETNNESLASTKNCCFISI